MNTDEHGWSKRGATRVWLATAFWSMALCALTLALVLNNAMLRADLDRLGARVTELEVAALVVPFDSHLSSVGVPFDVDRAMQMHSLNTVR